MESVVIETLGCPLDPDLLRSWEQFSLESSHSHTSSDCSESAEKETEIEYDLREQMKNLSFDDVSDSKHITSKCSNKISERNSREKDHSEKLIFVDNKEIKESRFSSSLKNKDLLKFVLEADVGSTLCKFSNKNCEINSKKKNNTEKLSFVENLENVEYQLSSLSLKNNKLLNKYHKSGSDISSGDESDTDDDEQVESVILRERDPTRHNRTENNKQWRTTPFSRNHTRTIPHFNSNNFQTLENFSPHIFYDLNTSHGGYDSRSHIYSPDFERNGIVSLSSRTFHSGFPNPESVTYEAFEDMASSIVADQIFNNAIPCTEVNQIVNSIAPCAVTDQIFDDFIPYILDPALDSGVPSEDDIGNSNDKFFGEINDTPFFDNLKERISSGCVVTSIEKETCLDSFVENLTAEEVEILKNLTDLTFDNLSTQNHMDLIEESPLHVLSSEEVEKGFNNSSILNQNICAASTVKEISYPNNNQHNFYTEHDHGHFSSSKANAEETSLFSNLCKDNSQYSKDNSQDSQFYNSEYLVTKPGNYSNMVCKNVTSINCEFLSSKTSEYRIVSNEIEHEINKFKEITKNVSELSREIDWNELPFDELDDNAISECTNASENKMTNKKNGYKRKNINQTTKSTCKPEGTNICWMLGTEARDKLLNSSSFCKTKLERENEEIREQIKSGKLGTEKKKVIHMLRKDRKTKYRGTNLHHAIRSGNTERVFCIVESHKECHDDVNGINYLDSPFNKTVLDYSKKTGMDLLSNYLEENLAKESIKMQ